MTSANNEGSLTRVLDFVARETGRTKGNIHLSSRLFHDLGVDGEDGIDLIEKFGTEFSVDLSTFVAGKHFGPEAAFIPSRFFSLAGGESSMSFSR